MFLINSATNLYIINCRRFRLYIVNMRQYVHSEMPRLRWTSDLHRSFINAIHTIGGEKKATPKLIVELMGVNGVSISHVKSHLQMYRNRKKNENCQGSHNAKKEERRRKRWRYTNGIDKELDKYSSSIYSHKRLRACKVQSSLPEEEAAFSTCGYNCTQMASCNQQSPNQNDQVKRKLCAQWLDSKIYCRHPTLDLLKSGMEDLRSEYERLEEEERDIPPELPLKDMNLCYYHGKLASFDAGSICDNKEESGAFSSEEKRISISCGSSINFAESVLVVNSSEIDNVWRLESKGQDDATFDKKPMLREDDIRLELSISIP